MRVLESSLAVTPLQIKKPEVEYVLISQLLSVLFVYNIDFPLLRFEEQLYRNLNAFIYI